jgi:hypothetical protein
MDGQMGREAMAVLPPHYKPANGAKQEMESNWTNIGSQLVICVIALGLFGIIYNHAINTFPWLAHRRPAEQVVGGVLVTVLTSGFVIGWMSALIVLILFAASGLPMLIGSWIKAAKDDAEMKDYIKEHLHD